MGDISQKDRAKPGKGGSLESPIREAPFIKPILCTANILAVLSTAFGSVTFPTVIWL